TQKLFGWPGDRAPVSLASLAGLAGMIETMGGTMVAIGFWAAPAAFIASGTMAVAYVLRHAGQDLFPILNRGELALVYCFAFLLIAATGSGRFSVDGCWRARRSGGR
ncbi:MAG TPA: DoxX family protein, partial [Thermoanaerobaculia bacterium]|nr:DoxX family protein [Thermoanaerobaculia bacterium]